ncbi:hypothetical protein TraAM80_08378, partial [Trypanosoma rangeli]
MSLPFCHRSLSAASRATLSSLRSTSLESQRCDRTVSTYSIAGAPRSVDYGGKLRVWTAEMDGRIVVRAAPRGEILFYVSARQSAFCTVLQRISEEKMWAAFSDGFIRCYNSVTGKMEREFVQHDGAVHALASSAVSDYVYSGGEDWKVYQWSKSKCTYIRLFSGHANGVRCVLVVPGIAGASSMSAADDAAGGEDEDETLPNADGVGLEDEFVLSGGDDMTIKIWDPRAPLQIKTDEACLATLRGHNGSVRAMEVHPRSGYLWSGGDDCTILVWSWRREEMRRCVAVLRGQHSGPITSIVHVSPRMWSSGKDGFVVVWNTRDLVPIQRIQLAPNNLNCPILTMRRLYRATHWTVWLGGAEGIIQALQVTGDEHDVDGKLQQYEQWRSLEKRRLAQLQEKILAQKHQMNALVAHNEELEVQLRNYQERNILLLEDTATRLRDSTLGGDSVSNKRAAQIKVLRATVVQLKEKVRNNEELIMQATKAAGQKDKIIQSLTGQLSQKDAALQVLENRLKELTSCQESPQLLSEPSPMKQGQVMQGGRHAAIAAKLGFDAYSSGMEQLRAGDKLEGDDMQHQLLEIQKYKTLWEENEGALRQANEKIVELQSSLEVEKRYADELLQELSVSSREHTTRVLDTTHDANHPPPQTPTTQHYYRRLPGIHWPDLCKTYPADLQETLWAESSEALRQSDAVIRDISYTASNDCLVVDAAIEHGTTQSKEIQNLIETHNFPRAYKLQAIHASSLHKCPQEESINTRKENETLVAAKRKAEAERDNVQQQLRATKEELDSLRQRVETRRAQISGLSPSNKPMAAGSTGHVQSSPHKAASPLYTVTAEEYEAVSTAKRKAEAERDNVQQQL